MFGGLWHVEWGLWLICGVLRDRNSQILLDLRHPEDRCVVHDCLSLLERRLFGFLYLDSKACLSGQIEVLDDFLEVVDPLHLRLDQVLKLSILFPGLVAAILPLSLHVPQMLGLLHPVVALPPCISILVY